MSGQSPDAQNELDRAHGEQRFRKIFEEGPIGIVLVGKDTCIRQANRQFCEMLGYTEEEIIALTIKDITYPDDLGVEHDLAMRLLTGEIPFFTVEKRYVRKDGMVIHGKLTASLLHSAPGQPELAIGMVEDITQRKLAEEELVQGKAILQAAIECLPFDFFALGIDGRYMLQNATSRRHFGDAIGKRPEEICPDRATLQRWLENNRRVYAGERIEGEGSALTEGETRHFYNIITPIRAEGRVCGILGVNVDITRRKRAEAALAAARDELEQDVEQRTAELREANSLLQRERETLKHLLQSSDHERQLIAYEIHDGLAQQLAGAIMQLQTFEHLKDTKSKEAAHAFDAAMTMLRQGHFETRRLIASVRHPILDESGVVEAIAHLVHEQSRVTDAMIKFDSAVHFDRLAPTLENAIYRIAQEGLTNACRHGKSKRVRVSLLQRNDRVRIEVRDWGVGFDVKTATGSRFGLEGIRQRARLLGGRCNIRSVPDRGTRVTVELPVVLRD